MAVSSVWITSRLAYEHIFSIAPKLIYAKLRTIATGYTTEQVSTIRIFRTICLTDRVRWQLQIAPKAFKAMRSSLTAVAESSKFSAEIAHLACFCASLIESSSLRKGPCADDAGGGAVGCE
jgi:hypothetical protein